VLQLVLVVSGEGEEKEREGEKTEKEEEGRQNKQVSCTHNSDLGMLSSDDMSSEAQTQKSCSFG